MLEGLKAVEERWNALKPFPPDLEKRIDASLDAPFIAASNTVEDKQALGLEEVEVFLESGLTSAGRTIEDFVALERHREALAEARAKARAGVPLSVDLIRGLHHTLTRGLHGDHAPGLWKSRTNRPTTRRGRTFRYAPPEAVPDLMRDLVAGYEGLAARVHVVEAMTWFSYHFHLIHPFNDSNGRVQRLAASFILLRAGLRELVVDPDERGAYLDALAACDATVPADKLAPLYSGIETATLCEFFGAGVQRTLEDVLSVVEGRTAEKLSDVAAHSSSDQKAILLRLKKEKPELAWRQDAAAEIRKLHDRIVSALKLAVDEGPLYGIEVTDGDVTSDHSADPVIRPFLPAGGAGIVGQVTLALRPRTTAGLKMPAARAFVVVVVASRLGLHLVTRWENEAKPVVRHGTREAVEWSQSSLERHLAERVDRSRRAFDAEIVELNRTKDLKAALKAVSTKRPKLASRLAGELKTGEAAPASRGQDEARPRSRAERDEPRGARRASARNKAVEGSEPPRLDGIRPVEPPLQL